MAKTQQAFLVSLKSALDRSDGNEASNILNEQMDVSLMNKKSFLNTINPNALPKLCSDYFPYPQYKEFITYLMTAMTHLKKKNLEEAYNGMENAFKYVSACFHVALHH